MPERPRAIHARGHARVLRTMIRSHSATGATPLVDPFQAGVAVRAACGFRTTDQRTPSMPDSARRTQEAALVEQSSAPRRWRWEFARPGNCRGGRSTIRTPADEASFGGRPY